MTNDEEVQFLSNNDFMTAARKAAAAAAVYEDDKLHKAVCRGTHLKPKQVDMISFFNPTIQCFCQKPASIYYTLEYGPILECASYDKNSQHYNPRYVCGFHVHEVSWKKLHEQLEQGYSVCSRYVELRACPLYNFTYCAMFKVKNEFKSVPVNLPTCFCGKPIKMIHDEVQEALPPAKVPSPPLPSTRGRGAGGHYYYHHHHKKKTRQDIGYETLYITNFICSNRTIQGAQKCNFLNSADNSVYQKPSRQVHREVDYETFMEQRGNMLAHVRESINNNLGFLQQDLSSL